MHLSNRVALVTGSAHRVGKAIALALAEHGTHIVLHYHRSEAESIQAASEIAALGVRVERLQADLGDPAAIERLYAAITDRFGRLDVLVNSASAFQAKDILDITVEDWDQVMAVNLRAPFLCSQHAARIMLKQESGGVIVNIADVAGQIPWPRYAHHSASKAGLIMLTRVLAKALAPSIRVNAVVPGPVLKPDRMPESRWKRLGEGLPLKRTGSPQNVAQAVIALVENDFVTGAIWNVDGGDTLVGSVNLL